MLKFREDSPILIQSFYRISTEHFEPYIAQFSRGVDVYDFANVSKKMFLFMRHECGKTEGDENHLLIQTFKWHKELPSGISSALSYYRGTDWALGMISEEFFESMENADWALCNLTRHYHLEFRYDY